MKIKHKVMATLLTGWTLTYSNGNTMVWANPEEGLVVQCPMNTPPPSDQCRPIKAKSR